MCHQRWALHVVIKRKVIYMYLKNEQIIFVYEGHRVKVKVTGAKKRKIPYSRNEKNMGRQ